MNVSFRDMCRQSQAALILILIIASLAGLGKSGGNDFTQNLLKIRITKYWIQTYQWSSIDGAGLNDEIPDGWNLLAWGGAKGVLYIVDQQSYKGLRAAVIERNNSAGGLALAQQIRIKRGSFLHLYLHAKGDRGALQIQFRKDIQDTWHSGGWLEVAPARFWKHYDLSLEVPSNATEIRVLLRSASGTIYFDDLYLGEIEDDQIGPNLIINPGFEQDGNREDPIAWWENQISGIKPILISANEFGEENLSYLNIVNMIKGDYEVIKQQAREISTRCVSTPEMTSWLIALGNHIGQTETETMEEMIYKLAIELAPNCPQPYAALADLYASHSAFKLASELYHRASTLSEGTLLAGRYAFEEGFINFRNTGRLAEAISAFRKAEDIPGWDQGKWYRGVASLYLGYALEEKGFNLEAMEAYRRVIACGNCQIHRKEAQYRLELLNTETDR
jgi:hypothetical protein